MSSWTQFWLVTDVKKFFTFDTCSKDLLSVFYNVRVLRVEMLLGIFVFFHVCVYCIVSSAMVQTLRWEDQISIEPHPIPDYICKSNRAFELSFSKMAFRTIIGVAIKCRSYWDIQLLFEIVFMWSVFTEVKAKQYIILLSVTFLVNEILICREYLPREWSKVE
jgi:hypothetical protein